MLRRNPTTNEWQQDQVALSDIRESPDQDIPLQDGDIVMVEYGAIRTAWTGGLRLIRDVAFSGLQALQLKGGLTMSEHGETDRPTSETHRQSLGRDGPI